MKKKIVIIICVVFALVLLTPLPLHLKDGGSVEYKALLYSVTDVHRFNDDLLSEEQYKDGIIIEVLGMKVFSNVED